MRHRNVLIAAAAAWSLAWPALQPAEAKKKNPDDFTQTLALPKDPPAVASGDARRLVFHVSPLSGKGLLSQQTREALKVLLKENGGMPVVHIRAFVAGSGDVRRVGQIVSEVFTEKKMALPSLSVVLAGGLALENAQVVLETISEARRDMNPEGVAFVAGDEEAADDGAQSAAPLLTKSVASVVAKTAGSAVLQATCFASSLTDAAAMTAEMARNFPGAVIDLVQTQRAPSRAFARCEAISKGRGDAPVKLAFTGTRVAFGAQPKDAEQAFQHLERDLGEPGAAGSNVVFGHIYALSPAAAANARKLKDLETIPVEGLASMDAGFAVDAVAALPH